jgi:putative peptidoglycan lipid II flippase
MVPDGSGFSLRSIGRSAALVAVSSVVGQFFTLGRELFVASRVGTSQGLDALLVALVFPTILTGVLSSGIAVAVVPAYARLERLHDQRTARSFLATVLVCGLLAAGIGVLALLAVPGLAVLIAGPGLDQTAREMAIGFVPVLAPIVLFGFAASLLSATCQINQRFRAIALGVVAGPVVSLTVTVLLWDSLGITALALGWTINFLTTSIVLGTYVVAARLLAKPRLRQDPAEARRFGNHAAPLTASALINKSTLFTDRAVASLLPSGSISSLRYGEALIGMPTQAIAPAWTLVLYPVLVRAHQAEGPTFGRSVYVAMRYVLAVFIPLAVATAALAPLLVDVVYVRGAFDAAAASTTAAAVAGMGPLLVLTMIQGALVPAHNARQSGVFLLQVGIVGAISNLVLDVVLGSVLGVGGIALSTSAALALSVAIMARRLAREEPDFRIRELADVSGRAIGASIVPAVPIALVAWGSGGFGSLWANLAALVVLTLAGLAVYVPLADRLRLVEPLAIIRLALGGIHGAAR